MRAFPFLLLAACVDPTTTEPTTIDSYDAAELVADVAPAEGRETIRATISQVRVSDAKGAVIATAPAFAPVGSADEVVGIRMTHGLIAVTTTLGGHRESTSLTSLYRLDGRDLTCVFSAPIVEVEDDARSEGMLLVLPTTLIYRAPHAELAKLFTFDAASRRYKESP
jgi:hypothetical protein